MKFKLSFLLVSSMLLLSACSTENATIEKVNTSKNTAAASSSNTSKDANTAEKAPAAPEVFKIGDSVTFNDLVITVNSVKDDKGDQFIKPDQGNVYKIVDVTVENKGKEEQVVSSALHTSMVDSDAYKYTMTIVTSIKNQLDGSVPAGRKLRGQVAYEVPKTAKGLEFIFSDPFTNGQAIWKLN